MSMVPNDAHGSALIEAVIAAALLAIVFTGILPLVTAVVTIAAAARADLVTAHLARQRLAQLQTLTYTTFASGAVADASSRLDQAGVFTSGGAGLQTTTLTPLQAVTSPWADWMDEHGVWLASGTQRPAGAQFHRRWAVASRGGDGCLRLWVVSSSVGPSQGDPAVRVAGLQCPWGAETP